MFRHIVLIQFYDHVPEESRAEAIQMLRALGDLPEAREYRVGVQIRPARQYHLAEVAAFESEEAFEAFRAHPAHQAVFSVMRKIADWETVDFID